MNFKTTLSSILTILMVGGVFLSVNQNTSQFEPQAAVTETKRVWAIARVSFWFDAGVSFGVSTTTGFIDDAAQNYATYIMQRDENNNDFGAGGTEFSGSRAHAYYVDVPTNITHVEFFREASPTNRFNYSGWSLYTAGMKYILFKNDDNSIFTTEFAGFAFNTTKVVQDFADSIDTSAEACTSELAQTAINTYNAMATFDQNQFDVLAVSAGVTGLQRLEYLRSRFSIATALN
jgi:hypothetical protein